MVHRLVCFECRHELYDGSSQKAVGDGAGVRAGLVT